MQFEDYFADLRQKLLDENQRRLAAQAEEGTWSNYSLEISQEARKYHWQENELQECIKSAQRQEQAAIDKLCACFEPLIMKAVYCITHESTIPLEEARHHAWLIFIDLVMNFHGQDYAGFPGYAAIRIYSRLKRLTITNGIQACAEAISIDDETNQELPGPDNISSFITQRALTEALEQITPRQRCILKDRYLHNKSMSQIAEENQLSTDRVRHIKKAALDALNSILS